MRIIFHLFFGPGIIASFGYLALLGVFNIPIDKNDLFVVLTFFYPGFFLFCVIIFFVLIYYAKKKLNKIRGRREQ